MAEDGADGTTAGVLPANYGAYVTNTEPAPVCGSSLDSVEQGACALGQFEVQAIVTEGLSAVDGRIELAFRGAKVFVSATASEREMEDAMALTLEAAAARGLTEAPGLPSSSQRGPSSREHDGPPQPLQPQPPHAARSSTTGTGQGRHR